MSESIKAVAAVVLIVSAVTAAVAWSTDRPDATTWGVRVGCTLLALLALGLLVRPFLRADLAPDYLRQHAGTYFNRDGFAFAVGVTAVDGVAYLDVYFQNQFDQPCVGRVALRPGRGFFLTRANLDTVAFEVDCAPAAFGFARLPLPLPAKLQGKRQPFEVGAAVHYPDGRGQRLRFHDGLYLSADTNFGDAFGTALTVAGLVTGTIVLRCPATVALALPAGVAEEVPGTAAPEIKTLWRLGDPPLTRTP